MLFRKPLGPKTIRSENFLGYVGTHSLTDCHWKVKIVGTFLSYIICTSSAEMSIILFIIVKTMFQTLRNRYTSIYERQFCFHTERKHVPTTGLLTFLRKTVWTVVEKNFNLHSHYCVTNIQHRMQSCSQILKSNWAKKSLFSILFSFPSEMQRTRRASGSINFPVGQNILQISHNKAILLTPKYSN